MQLITAKAQLHWVKQDTFNTPEQVSVFYTNTKIDTNYNVAYYIKVPLKDKNLFFETDTTFERRLTPSQFYIRNAAPLVVVNTTFFSFEKSQNLNIVMNKGKMLSYNIKSVQRKTKVQKDTTINIYRSAIGINKKLEADIAWIKTDSAKKWPTAIQRPLNEQEKYALPKFKKWKMKTAVGGGPVLLQNGQIQVTNDFEQMFAGAKGLADKHPRTAMGYTKDGHLIIMVVQGRMQNIADGVNLLTLAKMMADVGCVEALNLDGGGSSCMLVNGKQTIIPSDKTGQRAVPAVFIIKTQ